MTQTTPDTAQQPRTSPVAETDRAEHRRWLMELTQIPTAAGRERRVMAWVERWAAERDSVGLARDAHGNAVLWLAGATETGSPLVFEAHTDHPAFVVHQIIGPGTLLLEFRGGVMDDYFEDAAVVVVTADDRVLRGRLTGKAEGPFDGFKYFHCELEGSSDGVAVGDVARWDFPAAEVIDGQIHTDACDNLASVAAALAALDTLAKAGCTEDVRVLLTRAEEIGFIGAIAACRDGTLPAGARVIVLENSRSFDDSPIGGGPIVRVGDRMTVFSTTLTSAVSKVAEELSGGAATPTASEKRAERAWKWQRKLMAGGACEATAFCAFGFEATCVCLPLGNYHNMADLAAVQAGTNTERPRVGREHVSLSDFEGMVDLLAACGQGMPPVGATRAKLDELLAKRAFVLGE